MAQERIVFVEGNLSRLLYDYPGYQISGVTTRTNALPWLLGQGWVITNMVPAGTALYVFLKEGPDTRSDAEPPPSPEASPPPPEQG